MEGSGDIFRIDAAIPFASLDEGVPSEFRRGPGTPLFRRKRGSSGSKGPREIPRDPDPGGPFFLEGTSNREIPRDPGNQKGRGEDRKIQQGIRGDIDECLLVSLMATQPLGVIGRLVAQLITIWSNPEYLKKEFKFSVCKRGLLSSSGRLPSIKNNTTSKLMVSLVKPGYVRKYSKHNVAVDTDVYKMRSAQYVQYVAVSGLRARVIATEAYNRMIEYNTQKLLKDIYRNERKEVFVVAIAGSPADMGGIKEMKKELELVFSCKGGIQGRGKRNRYKLTVTTITSPTEDYENKICPYYDAVYKIAHTAQTKALIDQRKERAKKRGWSDNEFYFDQKNQLIDYMESKFEHKKRKKN